ncbi:hypothetical protein AWB81_03748 [Caballeronia arationis]|jgi:hypothetical protein|uniref:Secreted protein n=1 Tax=Caballeronia arationis TaxID=1777142 RepID=A0A7Z7IDS2_9BURK|nr:hypothetical protein [Caballeronia arationis]SAK77628.1 hypothetical protein AWB81_03748 [Caballeronia arationis]SOE88790.1 hypothetical protein SAMN05446927_7413 [Caballeronia arationis]
MKSLKKKLAVLLFAQIPIHGFAQQQLQPPNDVDLRAAYCVPIVRNQVDIYQNAMTEPPSNSQVDQAIKKLAADAQQNLARLQRYLVPRMPYLDSTALLAAMAQGKDDSQRALTEATQCMATCQNKPNPMQCMNACTTDTMQRVRRCSQLDWLPF